MALNIRQVYANIKALDGLLLIDKNTCNLLEKLLAVTTIAEINISFEYDFCCILCNLIEATYKLLKDYLAITNVDMEFFDDNQIQRLFLICKLAINVLQTFSDRSVKFIEEAHKNNAIKHLFCIIKNKKLINWEPSEKKIIRILSLDLIWGSICTLVNLSRIAQDKLANLEKWKAESAVETLLNMSPKVMAHSDNELRSFIILANITDDDEIKKFEGIKWYKHK